MVHIWLVVEMVILHMGDGNFTHGLMGFYGGLMAFNGGLIGSNGNFNGIWLVVLTYPSEKSWSESQLG